jgi:stage II sporulation protein D
VGVLAQGGGTRLATREIGVRGKSLKKLASSRHRPALPRRMLLACAALVAAAACASRAPAPPPVVTAQPPPRTTLRVRLDTRVVSVPVEEYVAGCVVAELGSLDLGPPAAARARDVQAIVCRSYALGNLLKHGSEGFDLCATTHCQVYRPVPATAIGRLAREAAERTAGRILYLNGQPVVPVYHADCGGRTSAASDVWGGPPTAHLQSVKDDVCERRPPWRWEVALDRLDAALRQVPGLDVRGLRDVGVARRDAAGRAATVRLEGAETRTARSDDFRAAVVAVFGPSSLRSTWFTIARRGRTLEFEGRGNGHGVGLCQLGLVARAGRGESPASILAHYYSGATVGPR